MIEIRLPYPVSANDLWSLTRTGMRKSDAYKAWLTEAGWEAKAQRPGKIIGPYKLSIHAVRPDAKRRDLGNLEKAVSDLLQSLQIIENDCLAEMITMRWVTSGEGITVILEPAGVEA
jgi:Holliday junction resolvase RusA-like endonuclease